MPKKDMPRYRRQKRARCADQAFVELNGRRHYLGQYGSPESRERYDRVIAEWLAAGRREPVVPRQDLSILELCVAYLRHAEERYVAPDGGHTSSMHLVHQAIRRVRSLYGTTPVAEFGPLALQTLRRTWIDDRLSRRTVNGYTKTVQRMFRWGAAQELVPAPVSQALGAVGGLRRHEGNVKETEPLRPVPEAHIEAIRAHVSRQVWAMARFQVLTGARPGEVTTLRPIDLTDTSGPVWVARAPRHKTAYADKDRILLVGPEAQAVIRPSLASRPLDSFLFSPREAAQERAAKAPTHRRDGQPESPRRTTRRLGEHYTPASYRRAIERACSAAAVPVWTPHRLRHNAATRIRREGGIEVARIVLGHSDAGVTEIYAERDLTAAAGVMRRIG